MHHCTLTLYVTYIIQIVMYVFVKCILHVSLQVNAVRDDCNKSIDKMAEEIEKLERVRSLYLPND